MLNKCCCAFFCCLFILISCQNIKEPPNSTLERKRKFIKVIGILKGDNMDSIKKYIVNALPADTINYIYGIKSAQRVINSSNNKQVIDSIVQTYSVFYGGDSLFTYRLNFYDSLNVFTGTVEMSFLSKDTMRVGALGGMENIKNTVILKW